MSPIHPEGSAIKKVNYSVGDYPVAEFLADHSVNLPTHLKVRKLMTDRLPRTFVLRYLEFKRFITEWRGSYHHYYEWAEKRDFFRKAFRALSFNGIDGDYVEFGCGPVSFNFAFEESRRAHLYCKLWAFDSFSGLPQGTGPKDEHPQWKEGTYKTSLSDFMRSCRRIPRSEYSVVPGFFKDTLAGEDAPHGILPQNISLAFIDSDMYSSAKLVLSFLRTRLKPGMIIAFDDYFCWTARAISGERQALLEFLSENKDVPLSPYLQFSWHGMSFVVDPPTDQLHLRKR